MEGHLRRDHLSDKEPKIGPILHSEGTGGVMTLDTHDSSIGC